MPVAAAMRKYGSPGYKSLNARVGRATFNISRTTVKKPYFGPMCIETVVALMDPMFIFSSLSGTGISVLVKSSCGAASLPTSRANEIEPNR